MLTAVILSPTTAERPHDLPRNVASVNHISICTTAAELYEARITGIRKVQTEAWFYQDIDDPVPTHYPHPDGGIVYGDFSLSLPETGEEAYQRRGPWTAEDHQEDPFAYIRRAICDTNKSLQILKFLPKQGEYFLDYLLYYFLAKHHGSQYHANLGMVWRKRPTGMHRRCVPAVRNSALWLLENEARVLDSLK